MMKKNVKLRLEEKMLLGYVPVILMIVGIAIVAFQGLNELGRINKRILENDAQVVQSADRLIDNLLAQEAYGRRFLILQGQEMREMFWQRSEEFKVLVDRLKSFAVEENMPVVRLASLHDEFEDLYRHAFSSSGSPEEDQVREMDGKMGERLDDMIALIQTIKDTGRNSQYQKLLKSSSISTNTFQTILLLSGLGILFGLGTIAAINRNFSRSIRQLKQATEQISQGKFDHLAEINTGDELGELAGSFNFMARRLLHLEEMYLDSSPLTRLPGGVTVENVLQLKLDGGRPIAFCLLDLDNFKSYNDRYGYAKGNMVIRATADIIISAVGRHGTKDDFVGHIGGDDFAIIVSPARYKIICETIIDEFDKNIPLLYNPEDRTRGYIIGQTRQGLEVHFPLMSISIAVATNEQTKFNSYIELAEIASELKEHAKALPGSLYLVNRREKTDEYPKSEGFSPKVVEKTGKR
ncbi:MAG: hypothetical protein A2521_05960 [Deltaproteobacteria bacterium RIFOXYD12_FULL_57_12]|nr:MAG: hypothetical protein A2521_05960 [Deltaproteobacteria bacterium RIFOXYD12_FULL_57_12]